MTVGELLERWLVHRESLGRSVTTMREYCRTADRTVRPALGKMRLSYLTARDLDRLYASLTAEENKPTTAPRVHGPIEAALHQFTGPGLLLSVRVPGDA